MNISSVEVFLFLLIVIPVLMMIFFLIKQSRFRAWLMRKSEARYFREEGSREPTTKDDIPKTRWIQLPYSLRTTALMVSLAGFVTTLFFSIYTFRIVVVAYMFIGGACIIYGFIIHFRPIVDRKKKYEYLLSGVSILTIINVFRVLSKSVSQKLLEEMWVPLIGFVAYFIVIQLLTSVLIRPWTAKPGLLPSSKLLRTHRIIRAVGLPFVMISVILNSPLLTIIYLNLRYTLFKRLENAPIIYLRSFRYSEGPAAVGRIIAKVASRYGVVFAIVHAQQKGSELQAYTSVTEQTLVSTLPQDNWHDYISSKLRTCSVVIIDRTISSEGLLWEINKSKEIVDPSRIAILQKKDTSLCAIPGVWTLEYELGKKPEKDARKALKKWFDNIFLTTDSARPIIV